MYIGYTLCIGRKHGPPSQKYENLLALYLLWSVRDGWKRRAGELCNSSAYSEARAKRNGLYVSVPPGGGSPKILEILWLSIMAWRMNREKVSEFRLFKMCTVPREILPRRKLIVSSVAAGEVYVNSN